MGAFEFQIKGGPPKIGLSLIGNIDEDTDFSQINLNGASEVEIDLEKIKSINSCGIREWIKWLGTATQAKFFFSNCPKVIVDQINLVDGFLPKSSKVVSFYVPYYNDDEGSEKNVLFKYGVEFTEGQVNPPPKVQDGGGNEMEMDVIEAKYFAFIKRM